MKFTLLIGILLCSVIHSGAESKRPLAPWPPKFPVRMIIDTDADNEIDDQYAIALALGFPDRIKIEGFVVAHFGDFGGPNGIEKSEEEMNRVLSKAGMSGKYPVKRGAHPIRYKDRVEGSEGIDFIIEQAKKSTPENPLWLVLLGPATDGAVALLKDPSIADRLIIFWHGRTEWPSRAWNYNTINDIKAAQLLFELPCRFVLFDTGTYLRMSAEESKRRYEPLGSLGAYLQEIRGRKPYFMTAHKGFFDLGDIAAFVDPATVRWERTRAPQVGPDMRYDFSKSNGDIIRIYHVETEPTFDLLEQALKRIATAP